MKVCLITNQIAAWGKIGGFGTNTRRLANALSERGVDVSVVVPRRQDQQRIEKLDSFTVYGQSSAEALFGKKIYQEVDADIYHAMEPTISAYWAQRAMPGRIHLVTSMDPRNGSDLWVEWKNATWRSRLKFPFQYYYEGCFLVRRAVQRAHGVYVEASFLTEKTQMLCALKREPGLLPKPVHTPEGQLI